MESKDIIAEEFISEDELNGLLEEAIEPEKMQVVTKEPESKVELDLDEKELFEFATEQKQEKKIDYLSKSVAQNIHNEIAEVETIESIDIQKSLVAPVCSIAKAIEIFKLFEEAKTKILSDNDILWISDTGRPSERKGEGTAYIKRSGWRKLARFFGLSWDIESTEKIYSKDGSYLYKVRVKIWHPAGVSVISEGLASSKDVFFTKGGRVEAEEENVIMKAQTVAINRGISDILGCGEVAAEEL